MLGREVRVPVTGHGAAVGAAIMAGLASGVWASPDEVRDLAAAPARHDRPDQERAARYADRLALFTGLRAALSPLTRPLLEGDPC